MEKRLVKCYAWLRSNSTATTHHSPGRAIGLPRDRTSTRILQQVQSAHRLSFSAKAPRSAETAASRLSARPFAPFSPPAQTRSHATDDASQRPPADPPEQRALLVR